MALIARSRLTAAGDLLTYRGPFRIRVWHRDDIASFAIIPTGWPPRARRLYMHTATGEWVAVPIIGTAWPRSDARLQAQLSALLQWRSAAD
jgi:hypothetical protein